MHLSSAARRKLGNLADQTEQMVADLVRQRGGTNANVRQTSPWASQPLGATAEAAVGGDATAETAIKIVKQARRLGQEY